MTAPTLHTNGTHPDDLRKAFAKAYRALGDAAEAMSEASPNGRDYYPQGPQAFAAAREEYITLLAGVVTARDAMLALAMHVTDNQPETGPLAPRP